jgi:hypothetical protein
MKAEGGRAKMLKLFTSLSLLAVGLLGLGGCDIFIQDKPDTVVVQERQPDTVIVQENKTPDIVINEAPPPPADVNIEIKGGG